ncbi:MAG: NADH-quinone oxidoreductase subunit C [Bdellovibrionaceae bacterium]|nr:NADH-quinone oxidoreductase subunit C [Pseudobdellovibrionaceae bacterium]|tara:strand:- start:5401 stop:5982 length:582 start_codon:yes stop_codon:yes gene_type:complete
MIRNDVRTLVPTHFGNWLERYGDTWSSQISELKEKFGDSVVEVHYPGKQAVEVPVVVVKRESLLEVLRFLKNEVKYHFLADLTATDEHPDSVRFHMVYNLMSHQNDFIRIRVKTYLTEEEPVVDSIVSLWPGANFHEREVWDMFGVQFAGHPNLRRILMDERWDGHPLRKDYPLQGYQFFPTPQEVDADQLKD